MSTITEVETAHPPENGKDVSFRYEVNQDGLADAVEKYRHLEELAELFFAAKQHKPKAPIPARA